MRCGDGRNEARLKGEKIQVSVVLLSETERSSWPVKQVIKAYRRSDHSPARILRPL